MPDKRRKTGTGATLGMKPEGHSTEPYHPSTASYGYSQPPSDSFSSSGVVSPSHRRTEVNRREGEMFSEQPYSHPSPVTRFADRDASYFRPSYAPRRQPPPVLPAGAYSHRIKKDAGGFRAGQGYVEPYSLPAGYSDNAEPSMGSPSPLQRPAQASPSSGGSKLSQLMRDYAALDMGGSPVSNEALQMGRDTRDMSQLDRDNLMAWIDSLPGGKVNSVAAQAAAMQNRKRASPARTENVIPWPGEDEETVIPWPGENEPVPTAKPANGSVRYSETNPEIGTARMEMRPAEGTEQIPKSMFAWTPELYGYYGNAYPEMNQDGSYVQPPKVSIGEAVIEEPSPVREFIDGTARGARKMVGRESFGDDPRPFQKWWRDQVLGAPDRLMEAKDAAGQAVHEFVQDTARGARKMTGRESFGDNPRPFQKWWRDNILGGK